MNRAELIDQLAYKVSNFCTCDLDMFESLKIISYEDVVCNHDIAIFVTPLLEVLSRYAIIDYCFDSSSVKIKEDMGHICDSILDYIFDIAYLARDLFITLLDDEVPHPIVFDHFYKIELVMSLDESFDILHALLDILTNVDDKNLVYQLVNHCNQITWERYDKKYKEELIPSVFINGISPNFEGIVKNLSVYSFYQMFLDSGVSNDLTFSLSELALQVSRIREKSNSFEIIDLIDAFENRYLKNRSLLYFYRKNCDKVKDYKQLYKKMD